MIELADEFDWAFKGVEMAIAMIADMHHAPARGAIPIQHIKFPESEVGVGWPAVGHRIDLRGVPVGLHVLLSAEQKDTKQPCSLLASFLAVDFNADVTDLAAPGSHYTQRVIDTAVRLVVEDGLPYRAASWSLRATIASSSPTPRSRTGSRTGGKGSSGGSPTDYLDWALSDFSGYIAADEFYDGPFCVLSIVDNRTFKRLTYQVLDHDPTHVDIMAFFRRFRQALEARGLTVQGITTDGSTLYPEPIAAVFGVVPHQVCDFPRPPGGDQGGPLGRGPGRKRLAAALPQAAAGPSRLEGGASVPPGQEADRAEGGRVVRAPLPVRPRRRARPSGRRCGGSAAAGRNCVAWRADGGGLSAVRSTVPDGYGVGQAGSSCGRGCGGSGGCGGC